MIFLILGASAVDAEEANASAILGKVENSSGPIPDLKVDLKIISGDNFTIVQSTTTDEGGTYKFQNLNYNTKYVVEVEHKGRRYAQSVTTDVNETKRDFILAGAIRGTIRYVDGAPAMDLLVEIFDQFGEVGRAITGRDGSYTIGDLMINGSYQVTFIEGGIPYSKTIQVKENTPLDVDFTIYEITTSDEDIATAMRHIVINPQDGMLDVTEYIIYHNIGEKVFNNSMLYVWLPKDRRLTQPSIMECCFVQYDDHALVDPMDPIMPEGQFQLAFRYRIPIDSTEYIFKQGIKYRPSMLGLFVRRGEGVTAEVVEGLRFEGISTLEDRNYYSFTGLDLAPGSNIAVRLSGLKLLDIKVEGIAPPKNSKNWAWLVAIVILLIPIGYLLIRKRDESRSLEEQDESEYEEEELLEEATERY
ncbi:MAG: collagen binding domain-containing protein [Candidatus Hydrothermarchaeales archaeon]